MSELTITFDGLCLMVPDSHDKPVTDFVDVVVIDALKPLPTSEHGNKPAECKVHAPHIARIIFNSDDVYDLKVSDAPARLWSLAEWYPSKEISWLLNADDAGFGKSVIRLLDGSIRPPGAVTLVGEDDGNIITEPGEIGGVTQRDHRWIPDTHRIFHGLGIQEPTCPKEPAMPKAIAAKMRLYGGSLASEDVIREAGSAKAVPYVFTATGMKQEHRQFVATSALYTLELKDRLVLESYKDDGTTLALRVVFKKGPVSITISNEPLPFMMKDLVPDEDFELVFRALENVKALVKMKPGSDRLTETRPCGCTSC